MSNPASPRSRLLSRRNVLLGAFGTLTATGIAQYGTKDRLEVRRESIALPKWKADGFRAAFVSDLHLNTEPDVERGVRAMQLAIEEKPDVLLLGGDYLNFPESVPKVREWLRKCDFGGTRCFAVLGNHDFWGKSTKEISQMFKEAGIRLLRNQTAELQGVTILGIDDGIEGKDRHDVLERKDETGSILALFHEPDFVERVDSRISLMLAGHSHGGQICWPFGKPMHMPRGARKYWDGFYPNAKVPLFVSKGVGMTGPRVRVFCRPDISILTLRSAT